MCYIWLVRGMLFALFLNDISMLNSIVIILILTSSPAPAGRISSVHGMDDGSPHARGDQHDQQHTVTIQKK